MLARERHAVALSAFEGCMNGGTNSGRGDGEVECVPAAEFVSCNLAKLPPSPRDEHEEGLHPHQFGSSLSAPPLSGALGRLVYHPLGLLGRPGTAICTHEFTVTLVVNVTLKIPTLVAPANVNNAPASPLLILGCLHGPNDEPCYQRNPELLGLVTRNLLFDPELSYTLVESIVPSRQRCFLGTRVWRGAPAAEAAFASAEACSPASTKGPSVSSLGPTSAEFQFQEFVLGMEMPLSWLCWLQSQGSVQLSVDVVRVASDAGREEQVLRWTEPVHGERQGKELCEAWDLCMLHSQGRRTFSLESHTPSDPSVTAIL